MTKRLAIIAIVIFVIAFFAPEWSVAIAMHGANNEAQQYSGLQSVFMGFYNLVFVVPSLIFLILGHRRRIFYVISITLSIISALAMCIWALGGAS